MATCDLQLTLGLKTLITHQPKNAPFVPCKAGGPENHPAISLNQRLHQQQGDVHGAASQPQRPQTLGGGPSSGWHGPWSWEDGTFQGGKKEHQTLQSQLVHTDAPLNPGGLAIQAAHLLDISTEIQT